MKEQKETILLCFSDACWTFVLPLQAYRYFFVFFYISFDSFMCVLLVMLARQTYKYKNIYGQKPKGTNSPRFSWISLRLPHSLGSWNFFSNYFQIDDVTFYGL